MWKIVASLILVTSPVFAQSVAAGTLRDQCQQALTTDGKGRECAGYVSGVLDADRLWYAAMLKERHLDVLVKFYCIPDNFETKDAAKVFVDWLAKNPTFDKELAANAIAFALRDKFPCK
jgi:hypothetical protein